MSFRTFNSGNPCPLCGSNHSCAVSDTGLHHCHHKTGEEVAGWIFHGVSKIGFGMYSREEDRRPWYSRAFDYLREVPGYFAKIGRAMEAAVPIPGVSSLVGGVGSASSPSEPDDPDRSLRYWLAGAAKKLQPFPRASLFGPRWARELDLPDPSVFEMLDAQWLPNDDRNAGDVLCFPERDGEGNIIGYSRRYSKNAPGDGRKMAIGRRGILIPRGLTPTGYIHGFFNPGFDPQRFPDSIYLVEGASDTLALLAMGRNVIGRPSATGGAEHLVTFLRRLPPEWLDLVVVGENDGKPDGKWPGRAGAYGLAKRLADEFNRRVRIVFPPHEFKDVRDWFRAEMRRADPKTIIVSHANFAASGWDRNVAGACDVQKPNQPLRFSDTPASAVPVQNSTPKSIPGQPRPPVDIMPQSREIQRKRACGELPDPYAEEEAAAREAVRAMRADQGRFPCSCPRHVGFYNFVRGFPWVAKLRCEKRSCAGCRGWLNFWEVENAKVHFGAAERGGRELYRLEGCGDKDWAALRRLIAYGGGSYLVYWLVRDGRFIVFATLRPSERSRFASAARPISAAEAVGELEAFLSYYYGVSRPLSTSDDWKRIDPDERRGESRFVGELNSDAVGKLIEIAETVEAVAIPRVARRHDSRILLKHCLQRAKSWDEESLDHIYACWFTGEVIPFRPGQSRQDDLAKAFNDDVFVTPFG